jgi:hypothetical protein
MVYEECNIGRCEYVMGARAGEYTKIHSRFCIGVSVSGSLGPQFVGRVIRITRAFSPAFPPALGAAPREIDPWVTSPPQRS